MKSKKGQFSTLGKLVLAIALFVLLAVALFGTGLLPKAFDKLKQVIKGVPEIDPQEKELNFFRNNDLQLEFLTNFDKALQTSLTSVVPKDACLTPLPNFDAGFYIDSGNYNLYLDQAGPDINIRLTRWAKQDIDPNSKKVESPVTATVIKNAKLCVIKDSGATEFYNEFNIITSKTDVPDVSKITPTEVSSIIVSSGIEEAKKLERQMGFKLLNAPADADYEYHTLFKKKDRSVIYAMRLQKGTDNYICFLPAYNSGLTNSCSPPKGGFIDADCFDGDGGKNTLKTNIGTGLIPAEFVCGNTAIVDPYCVCGGTKSGVLCENDFSQAQCDCAQTIVNAYTSTYLGKLMNTGFSVVTSATGAAKCSYNPAEECKYLLTSQPNFLNDIKSSMWKCTA
jgi:hypothetical protein